MPHECSTMPCPTLRIGETCRQSSAKGTTRRDLSVHFGYALLRTRPGNATLGPCESRQKPKTHWRFAVLPFSAAARTRSATNGFAFIGLAFQKPPLMTRNDGR